MGDDGSSWRNPLAGLDGYTRCWARGWRAFGETGPEIGPEGMACADLAALAAGCILDEPDGWLLPLPDGGVGFWPES